MHIILYRKIDTMMYQFINESGGTERCAEAHGTEPVVTAKKWLFWSNNMVKMSYFAKIVSFMKILCQNV